MLSLRISSTRLFVALCAFAGMSTLALAQRMALTAHVPQIVKEGRATRVAAVPGNARIQLVLSLPLRNQDALNTLLADLYNPASPSYHRWLQPADFDARFGPTYDDYATLVAWARGNGFDVVAKSGNKRILTVAGSAAVINRAFHLQLNTYHDGNRNRDFLAPDREPSTDLSIPLLAISGLDTSSPRVSHHLKQPAETLSRYVGLRDTAVKPSSAATGSGPGGTFLPSDMRVAYYGSGSLTGSGQSVAIFSYDGYLPNDVNLWYTDVGVTPSTVPITNVLTGSFDGGCELNNPCDDGEQVLDILQVQGMAPGLSHIYFYEGLSAVAELNQMVSDNNASVITSSWSGGDFGPATDPYFLQMAAQGQTYLNATGDSGAFNGFTYLAPASSPYITEVGGTDLTTAGAGGPWSAETGWLDSGGGFYDPFITIPSWQQTSGVINANNAGSTTLRNSPDIAAEANFDNTLVSNGSLQSGYGGTSYATPRMAGYLALANQQSSANGTGRLGFINPTLYFLGLTSQATYYHDITSGTNTASTAYNGYQNAFNAVAGYDLVTGWGSPNGPALLNALTGPNFSLSVDTSALTLARGQNGSVNITVNPINNFTATPTYTVTGMPAGSAYTTSISSTVLTLGLTAGTTTAIGTYPITVTATSGGFSHSISFALTIGKRAGYDFTISAANVTVSQNSSRNGVVTVQDGSGYNGPVDLTVGSLPAGVTASFGTPSTMSTSNLLFTVGLNTAPGSYTVVVTGTAAGVVTHSVSLTLTIAPVASVLLDGNFEQTTGASPWRFTSTLNGGYFCDETCGFFQHSGTYFAYLNGFGRVDTDTLSQTFTIPRVNSATLYFWLLIASAETSTTASNDTLTVTVTPSGGTATTLTTLSNLNNSAAYVPYSFDLSTFIGQTVTLKFIGVENSSRSTAFLLDDISVITQ